MFGFLFGSKDKKLVEAARKGALDEVRALLGKGASPNASHGGFSALGTAISEGEADVARALLEAGADPGRPGDAETDALSMSVMLRDEAMTTLLLERGARIDVRAEEGFTALHLAAGRGTARQLELLLKDVPVDLPTADGRTPLHEACWWGAFENAELLLARGASVTTRTHDSLSPLGALVGNMGMWSLMEASPDGTEDVAGLAALVQAASQSSGQAKSAPKAMLGLIDRLITAGADLKSRDHDGRTVLERAIHHGAAENVLERLVARGAR